MADETNNRNAVFKFYLNRQGVKGNKGEKGEQGFSPVIEVSENTANSYKLQITTETDQFETPNLRGNEIDTSQGGSYVRYNEETQQMYVGTADSASTTQAGMIKIASDEDIANLSENAALTPDGLVNNAGSILQSSDSSISITQDPDTLKIDLKANVAGDISRLEARVAANEILLGSHQISINNLDRDKVDKVAGKGLSTNDFTDAEEEKLTHAVVDEDLANVAFTGDYTDLINKPTIPVIPANNLTGDNVDGTSIVYDNITGKISATAQTPDLSNYVTKNTAQEINNTKTFLGNSLQVGNGNDSDIVASYDSVIYPTTETGFSRVAGTVIGSLLQGSNSTLATQSMFEYDDDIQGFKIATIFNDFNLTGGTNIAIIKNTQTGKYEIVAHDTVYSQGNGIDINTANQISVKVDGNTVQFNANGELEAQTYTLPTASTTTLGGVKIDGTTITIDNDGVISSSGGSTPSNMVTTDTSQQISGAKTFTASNTNIKKLSLTSGGTASGYADQIKFATVITSPQYTSGYPTVGCKVETINGVASSVLHLRGDNTDAISTAQPFQASYVKIYDAINQNNKPYLSVNNITSTGGTVTITDNGINGINIEAAGGSTPTNMVTTDTSQTITANKTFSGNVDKDFRGDTLRLGSSGTGKTGLICLSNTGAKTWSICNSGYTASTFEIANFNTVTIQGGNLSSDSKLVVGHDSLVFHKSDNTSVDLLALEARIAALEALINGGNA